MTALTQAETASLLDKSFLTQADAAAILGVSVRTAGNMLARNEIDAVKVGNQWRIPAQVFAVQFKLTQAA